jgi:hypothetical protein
MKPMMNEAKVKACMKRGGSRAQCMKDAYPDKGKSSSKKKSSGKKPNPFQKGGY